MKIVRFVQLLGRGDVERTRLAKHRLDQARMELLEVAGSEQQQIVIRLEAAWQARLTDLLEENPEEAIQVVLAFGEKDGCCTPAAAGIAARREAAAVA